MKKNLAAWLAIAAMALNALWPLATRASPSLLVPICSVDGTTHYIELRGGDAPARSHVAKHCPLCVVGSSPVIATSPAVPLRVAAYAPPLSGERNHAVPFEIRESPARPRAPPLPAS